jgi:hypothetical protein
MPLYDIGRGQLAGVLYKIFAEITEDNDIKISLEDRRSVRMSRSFGNMLCRRQMDISKHFSGNTSSSLFLEDEDRIVGLPGLRGEVYSPSVYEVYITAYLDIRVWMPKTFGSEEMSRTSMGVRIPINSIGNLICCIKETN